MPGAGFTTFTAGSVLTATQVNTYLMQQAVMVFTNEAARDAAITSPSEGMTSYLTAPTVPTVSADSAGTVTGVTTVYNGSVWVCTTPIGGRTAAQGNSSTTSYTTSLSLSPGTNPAVTLVTGTTALVRLRARGAIGSTGACYVSVAVSGATTLAASDEWAVEFASTAAMSYGCEFVLTGLTAGTNTFTLQYKAPAAGCAFYNRALAVSGIA
jgi:hypothetical protein